MTDEHQPLALLQSCQLLLRLIKQLAGSQIGSARRVAHFHKDFHCFQQEAEKPSTHFSTSSSSKAFPSSTATAGIPPRLKAAVKENESREGASLRPSPLLLSSLLPFSFLLCYDGWQPWCDAGLNRATPLCAFVLKSTGTKWSGLSPFPSSALYPQISLTQLGRSSSLRTQLEFTKKNSIWIYSNTNLYLLS